MINMELMKIFISVLSIFFCVILTPCASLQTDQLQPSVLEHQVSEKRFSPEALPRMLRFTEQVKEFEGSDFTSHKKEQNLPTGKQDHISKQKMVAGRRGTRQEWMESGDVDPSQYFTMDYASVRRRRPIHNKNLPEYVECASSYYAHCGRH